MKEFIEKLNNKLNERLKFYENRFEELSGTERDVEDWGSIKSYKDTIEIVKEFEKEYNNGWIPCSERLPQESEPVGTLCEIVNVMIKNGIVTSGWCNRYLEKWYVLDHDHDYPLPYEYKDVIAWHPLPAPYSSEKAEWKDKVMKHFTKVE